MIENQINRNMRTTLIFRNLNISDTEKAWKDTKSTLAKEILRAIPEFGENSLYFHIEQAVRENISKASKSKYKQLVIITKFVIQSISEKVKYHFIFASREDQKEVIVSQMYSKSVNERINKALELRMKLKTNDPSLKSYIKYLLS